MPSINSLLLASFAAQVPLNGEPTCVSTYDPNTDYFPNKIDFGDDSKIKISYHNNYKIVRNEVVGKSYLLYQCGTPEPKDHEKVDRVFAIPIDTVAIADTTPIAFLDILNVSDKIRASPSSDFTTSPCVQKYIMDKTISAINSADPAVNAAVYNAANLTIGVPEPISNNVTNYIAFPATLDAGELRRYRYLGYLAAFFNLEKRANDVMDSIENNYECLRKAANEAAEKNGKPTVAWVSQFGGNLTISLNPTWEAYTKAAGGQPLSGISAPANVYTDFRDFARALYPADVIIDMSSGVNTMNDFIRGYGAEVVQLKAFKNGHIYATGKRVDDTATGNDWFESAIVNEHIVLGDLVSIFHAELLPKYERTYLFNIIRNEQPRRITADDCVARPANISVVTCPTEEITRSADLPPTSWSKSAASPAAVAGVSAVVAVVAASLLLLA